MLEKARDALQFSEETASADEQFFIEFTRLGLQEAEELLGEAPSQP